MGDDKDRGRLRLFDTRWDGNHGIGRYSAALFRRLDGFQRIEIGGHPSDPIDPWRLGRYLGRVRPALYFSPGFNVPWNISCPTVLTVHDLNHLYIRENGSILIRLYYARLIKPALRKASLVFTPSEFSKRQILEWAGMPEHRLISIRPGISAEFRPDGQGYRQSKPYFLYVGNHGPHKNLKGILAAFAASRLKQTFDFLATGDPEERLCRLVEDLDLGDSMRFVGRVPDSKLAALYRGATALVFVSLYEGFGMPIIESMACGTPVLTSNVTAMPEAAGGAALLVDPTDVDEIARGMQRLAADADLRGDLRRKGFARASEYSWDVTAKEIQAALDEIV